MSRGFWMKRSLLGFLLVVLLAGSTSGMTPEDRRSYRAMLLLNLPDVPSFNQWIQKTDELPPDFDALPRHNGLPDPLTFFDGKPVKTPADWKARREEIRHLFEKYAWGSIPPPPKLQGADVERETQANGYRTREVRLHFGPEGKA